MKLIATQPLRYAGRSLKPGDAFEAGDRDARLLVAIRKAKAEPEPAPEPVPEPPSEEIAVQEPETIVVEPPSREEIPIRTRRRYRRRDVSAED